MKCMKNEDRVLIDFKVFEWENNASQKTDMLCVTSD